MKGCMMGIVKKNGAKVGLRIGILTSLILLIVPFGLASAVAQDVAQPPVDEEREQRAEGENLQANDVQDDTLVPDSEAIESDDEEAQEGDQEGVDEGVTQNQENGGEETTLEDGEPIETRDWGRLQPIADVVEAGGPIIIILALLSVLSLAIVGVKLIQFFFVRPGDYRFVERAADILAGGKLEEALEFVSGRRGVVARVMETALRGRVLGVPNAKLREEVERVARFKLDGLESGLPFLSLIATISPLLGLLGTVLGMIEAFQQLENAGDRVDPAILSGGIWEALLTTAAGLSVAIPAAAFYTWLQRTVDVSGQHMEDAATRVFTADIYGVQPGADSSQAEGDDD